jgi:perosamine synthetase
LHELLPVSAIRPLLAFEPYTYPYQMFGIRSENRDKLMIHLKSNGIATGCHYTPLSLQPLFKEWGNNCPFIEKEHNFFITLPLHADLTGEEVQYVINRIKDFQG